MAIQTSCPNCEATYTLADTQRGKKVRCRKCSEIFTVKGAKDADAPEPAVAKSGKNLRKDALQSSPRPPAKSTPPPKTKPAAKPRRDRDEDDDDDLLGRKAEHQEEVRFPRRRWCWMIIGGNLVGAVPLRRRRHVRFVYWWVSSTQSQKRASTTLLYAEHAGQMDPNASPLPGRWGIRTSRTSATTLRWTLSQPKDLERTAA